MARRFVMSELSVTKDTFYSELLNRFFNPNSYFFKCLARELEAVMAEAQNAGDDKYLLLGNLVDRLVAADDTADEVSALTQIEGFREFTERLQQGANFLYEADLDAERMKAEIDGLAHSLFNSVLLAMQDPRSVEALEALLGVQSAQNSSEKDSEIEELPSEELPKAQPDPEPELRIKEESQPRIEARTLLTEVDGGTDAAPNVEVTCGSDDEGSSAIFSEPSPRTREVGHEPTSLVAVFQRDMDQQIARLKKISADWQNRPEEPRFWNESERLLGSIALSCVVYGFEAFEQVAAKSRKALQNLGATPDTNRTLAVEVLDETARVLAEFLEGAPEKVEAAQVEAFTLWLKAPKKPAQLQKPDASQAPSAADIARAEQATPEQATGTSLTDSPSDLDIFKPENVTLPGEGDEEILSLIAEINRENGTPAGPETDTEFSSAIEVPVASALIAGDFTLSSTAGEPAEAPDSDRVFAESFNEASAPRTAEATAPQAGPNGTSVQPFEEVELAADPAEGEFPEAREVQAEPGFEQVEPVTAHAETPAGEARAMPAGGSQAPAAVAEEPVEEAVAVQVVENTPVALYKQQAGLYFGVIEEALATLRTHRKNMSALEDLELAANALYGLTLKLNLDEFGVFPDLVLTLIKNTLAAGYAFSDAEHELLLNAFAYFQRLRNRNDLKADAYQGVIASLRDLNGRIREHARKGAISRDERESLPALR